MKDHGELIVHPGRHLLIFDLDKNQTASTCIILLPSSQLYATVRARVAAEAE